MSSPSGAARRAPSAGQAPPGRPPIARVPLPPPNFPEALPVSARRDEIARAIAAHPVVIVSGETGSGKTTQLPKICAMAGRGATGLIGHTQPRRIAATTVARRIAQELGSALGEHVGYKIRFTEKVSPRSTIKLMTDGILLAETQSDPLLSAYDTIIVDEAHERSLNIDFLLGYLKQLLDGPRRDDLKVVITSATIDAERFARHFGQGEGEALRPAPVIEVSGRLYPVEIRWRPLDAALPVPGRPDIPAPRSGADGAADGAHAAAVDSEAAASLDSDADAETDEIERDLPTAIEHAIEECWRERPGDVLVFLPGEREIRDAQEQLRRAFGAAQPAAGGGRTRHGPVEILPLYARLSAAEQDRVFSPGNGRRIVLATNVAETSLTVPGIRYVVDSGLARVKRYRPRGRIEQLQVEKVSRAAANQRAGRCGRVAEGVCVRLYAEDDFAKRDAFTDPEILRSSLAGVILRMRALKLADIGAFPFLDAPPRRAIADGYALLHELGAIEGDDGATPGALTPAGRQLARLPLDPRIGRMLLAARERGCLPEALVIAAALSVQDPRERPLDAQAAADQSHARFADPRSDFVSFLKLWRHWKAAVAGKASHRALDAELKRQFLSPRRLREWGEVHGQLKAAIEELGGTPHESDDRFAWLDEGKPDHPHPRGVALHQALLAGLVGTVGMRAQDEPHYLGTHATRFFIHPGSGLARRAARWVMAAELVDTTRLYARNVARIEADWVERAGAHLLKRAWSEPHWEKRAGQVVAFERATLYGLTVYAQRRVHFADKDPRLARELLIRHALVEGDWDTRLPFFAHNRRLVAEIEALEHKIRRPDLLVDDELLYAYYDAKIPPHVTSAQALDQWWRETSRTEPKLLYLSRDELLRKEAGGVSADAFPKRLVMRGVAFDLDYVFDPGSPRDGVTMTVPLHALNQVDAARCDWLVPGMLADKVAALLKSLPQKIRHRCQPLAEFAERFSRDQGPASPGSPSTAAEPEAASARPWRALAEVLAEAVRAHTQLRTTPEDFRAETLAPHLSMRFALIDEHGRELAASRNLAQIRAQWGDRAQARFRQAVHEATGAVMPAARQTDASGRAVPQPANTSQAARQPADTAHATKDPRDTQASRTARSARSAPSPASAMRHAARPPAATHPASAGSTDVARAAQPRHTDWSFGPLPEIMEIERPLGARVEKLVGYPALLDVGDAVELQVFDDPDEAARRHHAGLRRLFAIALREPLKHLQKSVPDFTRLAVAYMPFGTAEELRRELVEATVERACMAGELPRDAATFEARVAQARPRLNLIGQELARAVGIVLTEHQQVLRKLPLAKAHPAALADIEQQLAALLPKRWVADIDPGRMAHLARYLKAIWLRLDKLRADPARDAQKMAEITLLLQHWRRAQAAARGRVDSRLDEFRWLLEELRVSLFAQELRTPMPVSVKRLQKVWESMLA